MSRHYLTQRQKILTYLRTHKNKSAYQVARAIECDVASVSSDMKRMTDEGLLTRIAGEGPRGGYAYNVAA